MPETKIVKAKCKKTGLYYGLMVSQFGSTWKVVDVVPMTQEQGEAVTSEVKQEQFVTNGNLLACKRCGNRKVSGCKCSQKTNNCSPRMGYHFNCVYCQNLELIFTRARPTIERPGSEITLVQGKKVKITFSNVEWRKFDNIQSHPTSPEYASIEPKVHVIADEERIEFRGYNVSEMNEGVYYTISQQDDFEIVCDVDTSTVQEHPRGYLYIQLDRITAQIDQNGGAFLLDGKTVAKVGTRFSMALSRTEGGRNRIFLDGKLVGDTAQRITGKYFQQNAGDIEIRFGFWHERHDCRSLTKAYIQNIQMSQTPRSGQ